MTITSHQIHNVLRTYGKQLRRGMRLGKVKTQEAETTVDRIRISSEAKRMQVVERVATEILAGLANRGASNPEVGQDIIDTLSEEYGQPLELEYNVKNGRFEFKTLDPETGEASMPLEDEESEKLNSRLVEITENIVDRTMMKGGER